MIVGSGATTDICINENGSGADPAAIRNNSLANCPVLYDDEGTNPRSDVNAGTVSTGEGTQTLATWGNISVVPDFVNLTGGDTLVNISTNNWSLASAFPALAQGGIDGSAGGWGFTGDFASSTRTNATTDNPSNSGAAGWSIGAFEFTSSSNLIAFTHASGTDSNPGSQTAPKLTINAATNAICVTAAAAGCTGNNREVRVAAGTYQVNYQSSTQVFLKESVSIRGGYDLGNWGTRDPLVHQTTIEDTSAADGSIGIPNRAVEATSASLTVNTSISGFIIKASPTNNWGVGVYISAGAALINSNLIYGGNSGPRHGLHISGGTSTIANNQIHGGGGSQSRGVYISTGTPTLWNNTIFGGTAGNDIGIMAEAAGSVI